MLTHVSCGSLLREIQHQLGLCALCRHFALQTRACITQLTHATSLQHLLISVEAIRASSGTRTPDCQTIQIHSSGGIMEIKMNVAPALTTMAAIHTIVPPHPLP
jgi:hypothetical protein